MNAATMNLSFSETPMAAETAGYARCIRPSKRVRWDIDADVLRNRDFDMAESFPPPGLSLVGAVDGIPQGQAAADAEYFLAIAGRKFHGEDEAGIRALFLRAYRWQYIVSGVQHPCFGKLITGMTTPAQMARIQQALASIVQATVVERRTTS